MSETQSLCDSEVTKKVKQLEKSSLEERHVPQCPTASDANTYDEPTVAFRDKVRKKLE